MSGALVSALGTKLTLEDVAAATGGRVTGAPASAIAGVSINSRSLRPGELFVAIAGPRFDGHDFVAEAARQGAPAALVHREVAAPAGFALLRVSDTTRALADLGVYARAGFGAPVVAITGSTGKTTTKDMAAALLATRGPVLKTEGNLNNRYGLPLTLLRLSPEHTAAVLELGMSAPGELSALARMARPDLAVITNVAPVHLEFFASLDAIAAAKAEVLEGLGPQGVVVLNGDDPRVVEIGASHRGELVLFGRDRRFPVSAERWRGTAVGMRFDLVLEGRLFDVALPLPGPHFVMNFLAAAAVAHRLGVAGEAIAEAATQMAPAPHRGELLRLAEGVTLLDDCYNSNPVAVDAAVTALGMAGGRRRVAFLGDMLELGPSGPELHREAGRRLAGRVDALVGIGPLGAHFVEGATGQLGETHHFADAAAASAAIDSIVRPGDAVLVKGSRGARLETLVDALLARFPRADADR